MYENEKQAVLNAALQMKEYRLISLTGGNVSMKIDDDTYLVTPSGMFYETMKPEDICVIDRNGNLKEGNFKPSSDKDALIYIYEHMPEVKAIVHTHQPYATAIGFNNDSLPACMVTLIDANHARINVAPWAPSSNIAMGETCVKYAGDANTVIMKHHGVITFGKSLEEAIFAAVYLEEAAKTYCMARIMGPVPELSDEEIAHEAAGWETYGQDDRKF